MYLVQFIYHVFLMPPGLFIVGLLLLAAWRRRRNKELARAALVGAVLLYTASCGLVSGAIIHSLESMHRPPADVYGDVIIVLGGGATLDTPNVDNTGHLYGRSANRLLTGLALYHKLAVPIIISGGQVYATNGNEAEVARAILLGLGVPADKIIAENASLNTSGNASLTAAILRQQGFKKPILVTSAFHMERAVRQFTKAGVAVVAYPTDYHGNIGRRFHYSNLWPTAAAMEELSVGLKEYLGLAAVRWY